MWVLGVESGCLTRFRGNSEILEDMWDKGDVMMADERCLCDRVRFWRRSMLFKWVKKHTQVLSICKIETG